MRVLIAGLGLIGGSIGMALRERAWEVSYVDPQVALQDALSAGAATRRLEAFEETDVIVIATPLDVALSLLRVEGSTSREGAIPGGAAVTTVCSAMTPFSRPDVIAGHPLAGSQERGLPAARADLFVGRPWFIDRENARVSRMIAACGAIEDVVDAREHDRAVALTSHLPQILSTALASMIEDDLLRFAGSGLRTFLRLAGSDASVWRPVIEANRNEIAARAAELRRAVEEILDGDDERFSRAQRIYGEIEKRS